MIPGQITMDEIIKNEKTNGPIKNPRVGSCFSGVGMWELALKYLGIQHEHEFFVEFDKYPAASYKAIHGDIKNYGDVTKLNGDEVEDIDVFLYSPPCQAFSVAGKGLGAEEDRGLLFNDSLRIIKAKKPKICILENVKGLTNKKHSEFFNHILDSLERAGYTNHWKILNTKDYGVPQNRERIFIVSIRNDIYQGFSFPTAFDNELRLKDFLETEVDEKYYLSDKMIKYVINSGTRGFYYKPEIDLDIARPITASMVKMHRAGTDNYVSEKFEKTGEKTLLFIDEKGNIKVREATKQGFSIAHEGDSINLEHPNSNTRRGRVGVEVAQTLTTSCNQAVIEPKDRIRKLTPKECWRLQGIKDEDFENAEKVNSNSQLYKQAGNGVSVNVVMQLVLMLVEYGYLELTNQTH